MNQIMWKIDSYDKCIYCGGDLTLLTNNDKNQVLYPIALANHERGIDNKLQSKGISKFKCTKCGREFPILWLNNFPYPMYDPLLINNFIQMNFMR